MGAGAGIHHNAASLPTGDEVITYLDLISSVIMIFFSTLQLAVKRRTQLIVSLSLIFLSSGCVCLYYWLCRTGLITAVPRLAHIDIGLTLIQGPAMYSYVGCVKGDAPRKSSRYLAGYLPALAVMLFFCFRGTGNAVVPVWGPAAGGATDRIAFVFGIAADISLAVYFALTARIIWGMFTSGRRSIRPLQGVLLLFGGTFCAFALFSLGFYMEKEALSASGMVIYSVLCVFFFLYSQRYPEYTRPIFREPESAGAGGTKLSGIDLTAVIPALEEFVEVKRVYRDPQISIQSLSVRLGIKTHQLSHILNNRMGTSFKSYINANRVCEAKTLLAEAPELSILDIGFSVGFNSKSSFNDVFMKETGSTPSEYRKKSLKKVRES